MVSLLSIYIVDKFLVAAQGTLGVLSYSRILRVDEIFLMNNS